MAKISRTASLMVGVLTAGLSACTAVPGGDEGDLDCEDGLCDSPFTNLMNLLRDDRASIPVQKLIEQGAPAFDRLACTELSRVLVTDVEAHDAGELDALVSGLVARFGEEELSTQVNIARRAHLQGSADQVYLEADARFQEDLSASFSLDGQGFSANDENLAVKLGFAGAGLGYRFVTAMPDGPSSFVDRYIPDTLEEMCDSRGFLIPRHTDDLAAMKPGDMVALSGDGWFGLNVGLSTPIFIGEVSTFGAYRVVLNAGYSQRLEGKVDTQVVKLDGDQVVVDVGIQNARVREHHLRLSDDFGIQSFCGEALSIDCDFEIFGRSLSGIVDDAIEDAINDKLSILNLAYEANNQRYRMSVARFRIDLGAVRSSSTRADADRAIAQAMVGDLRLLQALTYRGDAGLDVEFDLLRSGQSAASKFGVELFGANLFRTQSSSDTGTVVLQTPDGTESLFYDNFHESGGWGTSNRGYTRVGLGALHFDDDRAQLVGEANLIVQVMQSGKLKTDKVLDHLDGVIAGAGGMEALQRIEREGNAMMNMIDDACSANVDTCDSLPGTSAGSCRRNVSEECTIETHSNDGAAPNADILAGIYSRAMADVDRATAGMSAARAALIREAAEARFRSQSCFMAYDYGPQGAIVTDLRFDDTALAHITGPGSADTFERAVRSYLGLSDIDRADADFLSERDDAISDRYRRLGTMKATFDREARRYSIISDVEGEIVDRFGGHGLQIQLSGARPAERISRQNPVEQITVDSVASARARTAAQLFDRVRQDAEGFFSDLGPKAEYTVAYALLSMVPESHQDLRVHLAIDDDSEVYGHCMMGPGFDRAAAGPDARRITFGNFDVDKLAGLVEDQ